MTTITAPFQFEVESDYNILVLRSQLNDVQWGDVERVGTAILQQLESLSVPALIVDLSPLDYMGSAQVALLVRIWKAIRHRDGKMVVQVNSPMVRKVLTIAGLHALWQIVPTRTEAYAVLGLKEDGEPAAASGWQIWAGTVVIAIAGVLIGLSKSSLIPVPPQVWLIGSLVLAACGLAAGLSLATSSDSYRRGWGLGLVLGSVAAAVAGALIIH